MLATMARMSKMSQLRPSVASRNLQIGHWGEASGAMAVQVEGYRIDIAITVPMMVRGPTIIRMSIIMEVMFLRDRFAFMMEEGL